MDLYDVIGSFGPWQRRIFLVFLYGNFHGMWQTLSITFQAPNVNFRCVEPQPSDLRNATVFDNQCEVLVSNQTTPCTQWEYDIETFSRTIVSEWDLVCGRQWLVSLLKSIYMFGFLFSVFFFGQVSDWLGRFASIAIAYFLNCLTILLSFWSNSYTMFAVLRFLQAFGRAGLTTTGMVLVMEVTGPRHRTQASIAVQLGWSFGFTTLPMMAWFVRHWFWLQMVVFLTLVPVGFAWWIVPESPRWLLMRGKKKRLERTLAEAVAINGRQMKRTAGDLLQEHGTKEKEEKNAKTLFHVLKMPKMRKRIFIMIYLWMVNAFMYYGLSYSTNDIAGDPYLNLFVAGAVEFPSYALLYWGMVKVGRRPSLVGLMVVGGSACLAVLTVPDSVSWLRTVFAMFGKFCVTGSFGLLYVYTSELFPTVVRNVSLGTCSMCGRVGSILAPFVREIGQATHPSVPNVLYSVLALTSGLLALLLPETRGRNMPDTMEEGEAFGELPLQDRALADMSPEPHLVHPLIPETITEVNLLPSDECDNQDSDKLMKQTDKLIHGNESV